ncbi:GGDEF domain-containing protein [Marivita hallyeonensis]|uniref:Diguanylate cyclase n=1 Tax=Marivita hallyeonensis TaxID=996342 RepID=A0A1M5X1E9_9RHOB|nr:GGDEF domain-containing protein [Marivita hallyeonensis]SHH93649.1 diguanylate cyclase [Marivita hallyeonensis]
MISTADLLQRLRPLHVCVGKTGHISGHGRSLTKLGVEDLRGKRFLEEFEVLRPSAIGSMADLADCQERVIRLRLRRVPDIVLRGLVINDQADGIILDLSFGIAVVDAVRAFDLTAQDFSPSDLAVELLFLQEAKSTAMAASFNLNARLDDARLAAETRALTDGLTGLHNRRAVDGVMHRLEQSQTVYSVLHLDLDLFKDVNDTFGHAAGDTVLKHVAAILRRNTRKDDLLVRIGGDEFLIICPGLVDRTRLATLSETVIRDISAPFEFDGHRIAISASIGIGLSLDVPHLGPERVSDNADIALYAAKRSGRGQHVFWTKELGLTLADMPLSQARRS